MSKPESMDPGEGVTDEWSIRDGHYNPRNISWDAWRFAKNEKVTNYMSYKARAWFLAVETVTYAFEVCNQVAVDNNPKLAQFVQKTAAATATSLSSEDSLENLEDLIKKSPADGLASTPIFQTLRQIFQEGLITDRQVQVRSQAIVARLFTPDEDLK